MANFLVTSNVISAGTTYDLAQLDTIYVTAIGTVSSQAGTGILADNGINRIVVAGHVAGATGIGMGTPYGAAETGYSWLNILNGATVGALNTGISLSGAGNSIINGGTVAGRVGISAGFFDDNLATSTFITNSGQFITQEVGMLLREFGGAVVNSGLIASSDNSGYSSFGAIGEALGGICASGTGIAITNSGQIVSASNKAYGIAVAGTGTQINNSGLIQTNSTNPNRAAVDLITLDGQVAQLVNGATGQILSMATAVQGAAGAETVINAGEIIGNVDLGAGNDRFDGRGGTVQGTVFGGLGNDLYIIDDTAITLVELAGQGTDEVQTGANYALSVNFENLTLLGSDDINGTGNNTANTVLGNAGNNRLIGGGGADNLNGFSGDDVIGGGTGSDFLYGGDGNDTLAGGEGIDQMYGQNDDDVLIGGAGDDRLFGGNGDDVLIGGLGADLMDGEAGSDRFVFLNAADSGFGALADRITGFTVGEDRINLSNLAGDPMDISIGGPFTGTGPSVRTAAAGANTGVFVDVNGDGVADMQIRVIGTLGLTEGDFIL